MPIKEPGPAEYRPSDGEVHVLQVIRGENGHSYSEIKAKTKLSDTALSKFVRRLQHYGLILRDPERTYHITIIGLSHLMSLYPGLVSRDDVKTQHKRDHDRLWEQVRKLHEEVLRITWLPYADRASRLMFGASGGALGEVFIGALKTKQGKKLLSVKTATLEELRNLGYIV